MSVLQTYLDVALVYALWMHLFLLGKEIPADQNRSDKMLKEKAESAGNRSQRACCALLESHVDIKGPILHPLSDCYISSRLAG